MPLEELKKASKIVVGTKQTLKVVEAGEAQRVFVARDAEVRIVEPILKACRQRDVGIVEVDSMHDLGRACSIKVGAAVAAILE